MFRDEGEKACKGMDSGRDENHKEGVGRLDLNGWWCYSHHESQCPTSIARKRKSNDLAAPEARAKIQDVCHPFQCEINALHQRNPFNPLFQPFEKTLPDHMIGDEARQNEKSDQ